MIDDTDNEHPFCRVCFCGPDPELKAAGHLISPCSCTGSVRCIHLHCLRTWQATQRAQGRSHRSHTCELCGCQYAVPARVLQQEREQTSYLEVAQRRVKRLWQWCSDTAQGPTWQEALRYWRNALLVGFLTPLFVSIARLYLQHACIRIQDFRAVQVAGLYKATLWGIVGLAAGGKLGINSASRGAYCLARLTPGFMMTALLFPRLQASMSDMSATPHAVESIVCARVQSLAYCKSLYAKLLSLVA